MTTEKPVWFIAEYLTKIHHFPLITKSHILNASIELMSIRFKRALWDTPKND